MYYIDSLVPLANVFSGFGALVAAIVAIIAVKGTHRQVIESQRASGSQTYYELEDKFFHTDLMRGLRRQAAIELCDSESTSFDAFDDLGDFFDFIGTLVRRGALDKNMAWSSYYRRVTGFWHRACVRNAVQKARDGEPNRWDDFEWLVTVLEGVQSAKTLERRKIKSDGKLTEEQIDILLAQERRLPTTGQQKLWGSGSA